MAPRRWIGVTVARTTALPEACWDARASARPGGWDGPARCRATGPARAGRRVATALARARPGADRAWRALHRVPDRRAHRAHRGPLSLPPGDGRLCPARLGAFPARLRPRPLRRSCARHGVNDRPRL